MDYSGLLKIFGQTRSTFSSAVAGRPDPSALHTQSLSYEFSASSKFALLLATFWRTLSQMLAAHSRSTLLEHTPIRKNAFSLVVSAT